MNASRKRQKVASACERCRKRKLGCDHERPCQLCVRAGAECVARDPGALEPAPSNAKRPLEIAQQVPRTSNNGNESGERGSDENLLLPESSIVDLTALVLSKMSLESSLNQDTSALPGGNKIIGSPTSGRRHWRKIVEMQLPDDATLSQLVDKFFASVDWFMMVFEESLFRERYTQLLRSDFVPYHEENFLWLSMLVVSLGAHYASLWPTATLLSHGPNDLKQLSNNIRKLVEVRFLQFLGCATLEAVQITILLGSFQLFNGRPNVGLGISGAGVKIAQVINLHREHMWRDCSTREREARRRTWWALEVFDKYIAVAFGRPCIVDDLDCSVGMVAHPGSCSGSIDGADTSWLFHQSKFRLYRIMGQFIGRRRHNNRTATVQTIHEELTQWKRKLPSQLRIESYDDTLPGQEPSIPHMQAISLQLEYDNLHIILHRTVAFGQGSKIQTTPEALFSLRHLLEAAMRTSSLHRFPNALQGLRRTHANMHIGITLFTAGIVLCIVALSQPLSNASQRAKTGVMHLIRACEDSSNPQNIASRQSIAVLERLVAVVLQHENQLITGKKFASTPSDELDEQQNDPGTDHAPSSESTYEDAVSTLIPGRVEDTGNLPDNFFLDLAATSAAPSPQVAVPESLGAMNWDGNLSVLMDSGLADASQMWMWTQDDMYTFPQ